MEELITVNGQQYRLETNVSLTQQQKAQIIKQLNEQHRNNIVTLATCTTSPIKRTSTKNIPCTIDNASVLTPGYIYKLYINNVLYATYPTSGTTTLISYTFQDVAFNTADASIPVKLEVTDSCVGGTTGTDTCNVSVEDPIIDTVTISGCTTSINIGGRCTLISSCTDQFGESITCPVLTWTSSNTSVAFVQSVTVSEAVIEGVSAGTVRITATVGGKSNYKDVTVISTCTQPSCSFSIN